MNESATHFELKQIAKYILKNRNYNIIGEEICVDRSQYLLDYPQFKKEVLYKNMIDVVGLQNKGTFYFGQHWGHNEVSLDEPKWRVIGIEAKASLEDFKNGFCCTPERTYIIAPKGIIPIKLIPKDIGLFEVDLDNYNIEQTQEGFTFTGVYETIKAKTRIDNYFIENTKPIDNKYYQHWCKDLLRYIAYTKTNYDIYKDNKIIIQGKKLNKGKEITYD
jgi:hypothetical protein